MGKWVDLTLVDGGSAQDGDSSSLLLSSLELSDAKKSVSLKYERASQDGERGHGEGARVCGGERGLCARTPPPHRGRTRPHPLVSGFWLRVSTPRCRRGQSGSVASHENAAPPPKPTIRPPALADLRPAGSRSPRVPHAGCCAGRQSGWRGGGSVRANTTLPERNRSSAYRGTPIIRNRLPCPPPPACASLDTSWPTLDGCWGQKVGCWCRNLVEGFRGLQFDG